jgi:hypothetical protein
LRSFLVILTVFLATQSNAQAGEERKMSPDDLKKLNPEVSIEDREKLYAATQITINGKETPTLVPYHTRMKLFFMGYRRPGHFYRKELQKVLQAGDDAILFEYAQADVALRAAEHKEHVALAEEIGAQAESMTPLELANALEANTQDVQAKRAARYRAVIGRLSNSGQRIVTQFAFERIRPVIAMENLVLQATFAPEFFKKSTLSRYELHRSGKLAERNRERLNQQELERSQIVEQPVNEKSIGTRAGPPR